MANHDEHAGAVLLAVCHYTVPLAVFVFFFAAQIVRFCSPLKARSKAPTTGQRWSGIGCTLLLVLLYVGEGIADFTKAIIDKTWSAPEDLVIYLVLSSFVWAIIGVNFIDSTDPAWLVYIGAWSLGLLGELVTAALTASMKPTGFALSKLLLGVARVTVLLAVILATGGIQISRKTHPATDEERAGLLANDSSNTTLYGSVSSNGAGQQAKPADGKDPESSDDDGDEDDKEIKDKQRKRMEEDGGIWGYLKGFALFIPVINPKGNRKIQFFYLILGLFVLWQRASNVLIPNQVGVITRRLTEYAGTGVLPWKEIAIWGGLRWITGSSGLSWLHSYVELRVDNWCYKRVNEFAFNHVMGLSMNFHDSKDSGEIMKSVDQGTSISRLIEVFAFQIAPMLLDVVIGVIYVTYLFDSYIAIIMLITGVVYFWSNLRLRSLYQPARREVVKKSREESSTSYEAVSNWQTVSYFNRSEYEQGRYAAAIDAHIKAEYWYYDISNVTSAILALIMLTGNMCAIYLAAWRVAEGRNDIGSFVTLIQYWAQLIRPLHELAWQYRNIASYFIDAERLLVLIQTKPAVATKEGAPDLVLQGGEVTFDNVCFAYDERKIILNDVSFTAKPGQTVAFVGETGGGKSTTLKLLGRYYDVTGGSIKIDGQDLRDVTLNSLRDAIGVVPQDPSLFNRSILDNVRYAKLDATDDEVFEACQAAAIHDKIMTFPDKYNAKVGERGVKVSGGEKQRIAIARVLLRNPKIVMLDEATSAVDSSTESLIQEAFKKLSKSRTTFIIAHRLSTVVEADLIVVVDAGKIIERGTHDELLLRDGKYAELWRKQTREARKQAEAGLQVISGTTTAHPSSDNLIELHDSQTTTTTGADVQVNGAESRKH